MPTILVLLLGISFWQNLYAADEWRQDTLLLPQYCKDRAKGIQSAGFLRWRSTLGTVYAHTHHYCSGIYAEQKAKTALGKRERDRWLMDVIGEMQYVSRHCSVTCALYPELQTRWGWALGMTGQSSEAIKHFQLSIRAKPKYVPAYAKLSDLYLEVKQTGEARKVLDQGLKVKPDSKMLQRRLKELGAG